MNKQYALIGYPLGHSFSPQIHKELFTLSGIYADYKKLTLDSDAFMKRENWIHDLAGFNVTIPFKEKIIPFLDMLDPTAQRYQSVNVVSCGEKNIGYNTDVDGFLHTMQHNKINL
ncbi:MAG: shikimate dehydrogenase, partial [Oscillospiraceae bacterium]